MIKRDREAIFEEVLPGLERRILVHDGALMAVEFVFRKGVVAAVHTHPHEQIGYVVHGRIELEINSERRVLGPGDSYYISPNAPHGVTALENTTLLDVFTPQREDFLK